MNFHRLLPLALAIATPALAQNGPPAAAGRYAFAYAEALAAVRDARFVDAQEIITRCHCAISIDKLIAIAGESCANPTGPTVGACSAWRLGEPGGPRPVEDK
jgi:hypothetical protein